MSEQKTGGMVPAPVATAVAATAATGAAPAPAPAPAQPATTSTGVPVTYGSRQRKTPGQVAVLERHFHGEGTAPDVETLRALSAATHLDTRTIKTWFNNKRAAVSRAKRKRSGSASSSASAASAGGRTFIH